MGAVCYGECDISGTQQEVNAYHLEVQGCHTSLLGLLAFSIFHKVQGGEVAFGLFNNDAGRCRQGHRRTPKCLNMVQTFRSGLCDKEYYL